MGYQVRRTHRLVQRALRSRIERHGVTLGMWYYLRILWETDGLTQRELSRSIGSMEPTTLSAIASMEREGIVRRERNQVDRRKINVFLTEKGRSLQALLLPSAIEVVDLSIDGLSGPEKAGLLRMLGLMQRNLERDLEEVDDGFDPREPGA